MASQDRTVAFILEQLSDAGVSARKMFGDYGLFCDGKTVGVISDDQLFLKPTDAGRKLAPDAEARPAYPGAKPSLLIDAEHWDDAEWLSELVRATADALPVPKPKKRKGAKPDP